MNITEENKTITMDIMLSYPRIQEAICIVLNRLGWFLLAESVVHVVRIKLIVAPT
jgi:hypothetical protein